MTTVIRPARPDDGPAIEAVENAADALLAAHLRADAWDAAPPGSSRLADTGFVLVAETASGAVAGFVQVLEVDGLAHLEQISVAPEHGRRGVGRRLLEAAVEEAGRRGHERMTLRTYADVPWNAPFYAGAGFAESDPSTDFHRRLIDVEDRLGLADYGRRIQMTLVLSPRP